MTLLAAGRLEIEGRMPWSSNGTFLCSVGEAVDDAGTPQLAAIYKPLRAERPLWDFPGGLYRREIAAYELAAQLGWQLVPETVEREDAPLGVGSLQRFVPADFEQHYFTLLEDSRHHPSLRRMAAFDALANNADRKGGHCLLDAEDRIWGIDHGLCFHTEPKLRTVIWDWAGERIDDALLDDVARLVDAGPSDALARWLGADELDALVRRAERLLRRRRLPQPQSDRPYPWPLV
ncbi:MAG TPA: SCO1664 family protein [Acidimicrobiales bacterium]|nr:SCO1664 family protein [Acidimicrobiales bacterium]